MKQIDEMINLLTNESNDGKLYCIAGRPAMGKTTLMTSLALEIVKNNIPTAIFSLESSSVQILRRFISAFSEIKYDKFNSAEVSEDEREEQNIMIESISKFPLFINDTAGITIEEIITEIRKLKNDKDIKVVFIDYLQLINISRHSRSRKEEITQILEELHRLSREINLTIIVLYMISKIMQERSTEECFSENDYRKSLTRDIIRSEICNPDYFDKIIFIHRPMYYTRSSHSGGWNHQEINVMIDDIQSGKQQELKLTFNITILKID